MRVTKLHLAEGLDLPPDAVTEPIGIFANRGMGKSNAAHRFVEELYRAGLPSVVFDVKGDWYGIRSSADGTKAGLPFLIVGGIRGDVPLTGDSAPQWARFIVEQRVPTIFDLSQFSKTAQRRWVMVFAEELYRLKAIEAFRDPLMVVVDEADVLIPQRLASDLFRLLGAMEDIAKRGRQRGLGILIISQRVADVNKSVTDLLATLFIFAITGTRTRKAILDWIDDHADSGEAKAVVATLSSLQPGEAWIWSPGWLKLLKRITLLRPVTFDSHATPEPGRRRSSIKTMADVDLSAVMQQMDDAIEVVRSEDPKILRKRIAELERDLTAARAAVSSAPAHPEIVREYVEVKVPVVPDDMVSTMAGLTIAMGTVSDRILELSRQPAVTAPREAPRSPSQPRKVPVPAKTPTPQPVEPRAARSSSAGSDDKKGGLKRDILIALAQHGPLTKQKLGLHTRKSIKGGYFGNTLSAMRTAGLVVGSSPVEITEAGLDELGSFEPLPTGPALLDWWCREVGGIAAEMLRSLAEVWPDSHDRQSLGAALGKEASGGYFNNNLSRLRSLGLVVKGSEIKLTDDFGKAIQ